MSPSPTEPQSDNLPGASSMARYSPQIRCGHIGNEGQRKLGTSRVVLFGCGGLGTVLANTLVRAGVGHLRICDRDVVELDNLQRQVLFDESDVAANLSKAPAAAAKLAVINSEVTVEPIVVDVDASNIERLAEGADLLLDGTDNFQTRFLINDVSIKTGVPWVYGAVVGSTGLMMAILPHDTPCLQCIFKEIPPPKAAPKAATAGVLSPVVNVVASLQVIEVMKLLTGKRDEINRHLVSLDVWTGTFWNIKVQSTRNEGGCPCCGEGRFEFLAGNT